MFIPTFDGNADENMMKIMTLLQSIGFHCTSNDQYKHSIKCKISVLTSKGYEVIANWRRKLMQVAPSKEQPIIVCLNVHWFGFNTHYWEMDIYPTCRCDWRLPCQYHRSSKLTTMAFSGLVAEGTESSVPTSPIYWSELNAPDSLQGSSKNQQTYLHSLS